MTYSSNTYLHTSLPLENVFVLMTSGAIQASVLAALILVVVTISLASRKSAIFNTFSKFPSSILFRSKTEKGEKMAILSKCILGNVKFLITAPSNKLIMMMIIIIITIINNNDDDDLEVAHPLNGSSST